MITDTTGWTKIQGAFTANGTEQFITIGNFYSNANTHTVTFNASASKPYAYYYVEDVSIIPIEITAFAGNDVTICVGDSIELGRPPEVGLECVWWPQGNNSTILSTKSSYTYKATQEGVFNFVTQMDNCMLSYDTVQVTVVNDCNNTIDVPNTFTPNGDGVNDVWQVTLRNCTNIKCSFYNRWGNLIFSNNDLNNSSPSGRLGGVFWDGRTTSGEKVNNGVYYYTLEYTDRLGESISKKGFISVFN